MKKLNLFFLLFVGPLWMIGQGDLEWIGTEGDEVTAGPFTVSYSIGEPMISTFVSGSVTLTEGFQQPDIFALFSGTVSDSVWPGDANYDLIADNFDLLPIGLGYGATGPNRINATLNWFPQDATNWSQFIISGVNYKHLDANGDGIVDVNDTLAISQNFGLTHNKREREGEDGPPIYTEMSSNSLLPGDTLDIQIKIGTDSVPAMDLYGVAFTIELDTLLVDPDSVQISYDNSWLGDEGTDMITLTRPFPDKSKWNVGITRIDQVNRSGYGTIAQMSIIIMDDLSGKQNLDEILKVPISRTLAITNHACEIPLQPLINDSTTITIQATDLAPDADIQFALYPNPTRNSVTIEVNPNKVEVLKLVDLSGHLIQQTLSPQHKNIWEVSSLASGMYFVQVVTQSRTYTRKLFIKH